jgi:glycerol-3-phosphate O-acyltransferase
VHKLLREGHNVEFFIEGGRSRTGKLLAPKLGLLGMVVDAALADEGVRARRAQVVPISIGYEKVIEERSYAHELAGGQKKAEDVRGLLSATRVLGESYGRLNIQFDEPVPLGAALREAGAFVAWDEEENVVVPADEGARRAATLRLAHRIVYGVNRCTALTPTALCASALLASGRRGIARRLLLDQTAFLLERARAVGGRLSVSLTDERGRIHLEALDRSLDLLTGGHDLEVKGGSGSTPDGSRPLDEIYTVPDERRPRLAFYRNNAIHLYVADALVCLALRSTKSGQAGADAGALRRRTLELSRLLKLEFTYRVGASFETIFDETLAGLVAAELVTFHEGRVWAAADERIELLAGLVVDFVESYWVAARALEMVHGPIAEKDLLRRVHDLGEKLYFTGEVRRREACVRANYVGALQLFRETGLLAERDKKLELLPGVDPRRRAQEIAGFLA